MLWDRGYWEPEGKRTPQQMLEKGDLKFTLEGEKLHGSFVLVRMGHDRDGGKRTNWLLTMHHDEEAVDGDGAAALELNTSVASGRTLDEIAEGKGKKPTPFMVAGDAISANAIWDSNHGLPAEVRAASSPLPKKKPAPKRKAIAAFPDFIPPAALRDAGKTASRRRLDT
jgi:bifunctional non-homologous end joining protein LigD